MPAIGLAFLYRPPARPGSSKRPMAIRYTKRRSKKMNDTYSLSHMKWDCKYHVVFAPKYRRKAFYNEKALEIGGNIKKTV